MVGMSSMVNVRIYNLWVLRFYMSSYGMYPYVLRILHSTRFWYKCRGFAVINIDIISYLVVKNVILRFRPCWVYPVG